MSGERKSGEENMANGKKPARRIRRFLTALLVLLLLAAGSAAGIFLFVRQSLQPTEPGEEIVFTIEPGTHSAQIAEDLEAHGLIRNADVFKIYLRLKNEGHRFQAGDYALRPGMEPDEIIAKFNAGDVIEEPTVRITIPEGHTIWQIAGLVEESGLMGSSEFLELTSDPSRYPDTLAAQIPADKPYKHVMEGYIFPETYEFPLDASGEEIVARMLEELERKLKTLPSDWQTRMESLGLSFHEVLTVASLIEKEVAVEEERALVAGVIYNRLEQNMPLQIDATVQYALDEPKERLLYEDLEVDSPYNTYKYSGLPPGPIASPGIRSIEAALYPEETSYLYYVTKKDGTAEHYFAETYEEHLDNIEQSKRNAAEAGTEPSEPE